MTDDHMHRPVTVTLSLAQIFALRDLIDESLDHTPKLSPAASHHSAAPTCGRREARNRHTGAIQ